MSKPMNFSPEFINALRLELCKFPDETVWLTNDILAEMLQAAAQTTAGGERPLVVSVAEPRSDVEQVALEWWLSLTPLDHLSSIVDDWSFSPDYDPALNKQINRFRERVQRRRTES